MAQKIKASIIIEIMGRPKEHIADTIEKFIEAMGKESGIKLEKKTTHEPKKVEHKDKEGKAVEVKEDVQLYMTFAEADIEAEDIMTLMLLCFKYMPSHVEITEPVEFKMSNLDVNAILNGLVTRLHHYDSIAKTALTHNQALTAKLNEIISAGKNAEKKKAK